ncbi:uncharacterized protein LOC115213812 isoform X2 [Octopus sinensis]|uniref:Uncharacterized protein LOC115213812 isoform X2 n=1 Tax=Octopus sinensis TaxID=2607531 RepID=A0A7E6EZQ3_9MOLL|nr:uncharacterized protein LOC115213812 isoform X2 [Octopus sinensis]
MGIKGPNIASRLIKRITSKSFLFLSGLLLVIGNEYVLHFAHYLQWAPIPVETRHDGDMVLLLVSDPQIQGYQREPAFPVGYFSRWDADRYISRSFSMAFLHSSPDIILFLGDLMDEGSIATNEEYELYYQRLQNIFQDAAETKKIYVPGDNDIGGEGFDRRTSEKISRFERYFEYLTGAVKFRFASFFKLDVRFFEPFLPKHKKILQEVGEEIYMPFRIILNHESISPKLKSHVYPLLKPIRPHMVISGHWHKANLFLCEDCLSQENDDGDYWPVTRRDLTSEENYIEINSDEKSTLVEIMVPTCSYRMGEPKMGYGVLVIMKTSKCMENIQSGEKATAELMQRTSSSSPPSSSSFKTIFHSDIDLMVQLDLVSQKAASSTVSTAGCPS